MELLLTLAVASLGNVGATAGAGIMLLVGTRWAGVVPYLVSFATGTLLAGACLGLLPKALETETTLTVFAALLAGLIMFFVLERLVILRHSHEVPGHHAAHHPASGIIILVGDAFHNLADGVAIGAAMAASVPLGVGTGLAVASHETPQEIADFGILLDSGFSPRRALFYNIASALPAIPGALVAYLAFSALEQWLGIVLALSAASFLYIGLADLTPRLHSHEGLRSLWTQLGLIVLGVGVIVVVKLSFQ